MSVELYLVGGAVRDRLLGRASKDYDFTVVAGGGWAEMHTWLIDQKFKIFVETPNYLTIRAHFPKGWTFAGEDMSRLTGDFVLARQDGTYVDGRRPDFVIPGTLYDDQARRDFTMNSLAMDSQGIVIDPFDGILDIRDRTIRAVGDPATRLSEDALRALRALRFCVTLGFALDEWLHDVLMADFLPELVANVAVERRRDELLKMFKANTLFSMELLQSYPRALREAMFSGKLWLEPTLRQ